MAFPIPIDDDAPMPWKGIKGEVKTIPRVVPAIVPTPDFCTCCLYCPQTLQVFAGTEHHKNDQASFLFYRLSAGDAVSMYLWKDGVLIDPLDNNDNGTFYDFEDLINPDLTGYRINWKTVYDRAGYGAGCYQVKVTYILLGITFEWVSPTYYLQAWNEEAADGTVRIETYMDGTIESNPIDYTGLNWYSQYRLPGMFGNKQPVLEVDNYKNTIREWENIQKLMQNSYTLELHDLSWHTKEEFFYNSLLANRILVTAYDLMNPLVYKPVELATGADAIEFLNYKTDMPGSYAQLKLLQKKNNDLKRNG